MISEGGSGAGPLAAPAGPGRTGGRLPIDGVAARAVSKADGVERLEELRKASEDMEAVFIGYLTRALRATVPNGGSPDAPGADMYGSLLDDHLAQSVAADTRTGIAEALYRQLESRFMTSQGEGEG